MKKILCVVLSAMLLMLCACSQASTPEVESDGLTANDLSLIINGVTYTINDKAADLITAMGETTSYEEADSCAYDGLDKYYYYENADGSSLTLFTIPLVDGEDTICQIETSNPAISTPAGISVGSTLSDVIAAYGEDYTTDGSIYYYWAGEKELPETPHIYFVVENDTVTMLSIYSARNFG